MIDCGKGIKASQRNVPYNSYITQYHFFIPELSIERACDNETNNFYCLPLFFISSFELLNPLIHVTSQNVNNYKNSRKIK